MGLPTSLSPTPCGYFIRHIEKIGSVSWLCEKRIVGKEAREATHNGIGVREVQDLFDVPMRLNVARSAKGNEVVGGVVAFIERNALTAPVDVVNVQILGRPTLAASAPVAVKNDRLWHPEEMVLFGLLTPFAPLQMSFVDLIRAVQFKAILAWLATLLWAGFQNVCFAARYACLRFANNAPTFRPSPVPKFFAVAFRAKGVTAVNANALRRAGWLVRLATSFAGFLKETTACVAAGRVEIATFRHVLNMGRNSESARFSPELFA